MSRPGFVAAALLFTSAVVLVAPAGSVRGRWRRLLGRSTAAAPSAAVVGHPEQSDGIPVTVAHLRELALRHPGRSIAVCAASAGVCGAVVAGPVAGALVAVYGACGVGVGLRGWRGRTEARSRRSAVDAVMALAAELRAGLPVGAAFATAAPALTGPGAVGEDAAMVARRVAAAVQLAETSGAPLADVLDRLDVHLRTADRARATAAAQAAGARVSALLLAVMPAAGAGLGVMVGADPLRMLLHTPLGASCLFGAVVLQLAGLVWSARLSRVEVPV